MLAASMPMAGLTRSLPVFNGAAVVTGVSLNYALEGNPHPETLVSFPPTTTIVAPHSVAIAAAAINTFDSVWVLAPTYASTLSQR